MHFRYLHSLIQYAINIWKKIALVKRMPCGSWFGGDGWAQDSVIFREKN